MKRKVHVTLLGRRFTVKTEKDDAYVNGLARLVGDRLADVKRQVKQATPEEHIMLVALHLADELAEERERFATMRAALRSRTEALVSKLEQLGVSDDNAPSEVDVEQSSTR